jgi:AraC family transcriptional regulator
MLQTRPSAGFDYPPQKSQFTTLSTGSLARPADGYAERVLTTPGYNTSPLPLHLVGLHIGKPSLILHERDEQSELYHFQRGDLILTFAGTPIDYAHAQPVEAFYVYLNPSLVAGVADSMGMDNATLRLRDALGTRDAVMTQILEALLRETTVNEMGSTLYIEALQTQLCIHLVRHYNSARALHMSPVEPRQTLSRAIDYIHTHLSDPLSLDAIAAVEHLTPFHFARLFKQLYGVPPHQYVIQQRVQRAADLLRNPRLTVGDVALMVGFANHSHLTRHFRRIMGYPPRRRAQERVPKRASM